MANNFFKKKSLAIQKINRDKHFLNYIKNLEKEIKIIDAQIMNVSQELLKAQQVQIRSALNIENNWLIKLQKNWVSSAANDSANWHRDNLFDLYKKRRLLKVNLEKATGQYWPNLFKNLGLLILLVSILITLTFMSLFLLIYLLPISLCATIIYIFFARKSIRRL